MAGKLTGLQTVIAKLNSEKVVLHQKSLKGLIESAMLIRKATDKEMPKVPIDTGNLRASWFTVTAKTSSKGGTFKGKDASEMKADNGQTKAIAKAAVSAIRHPVLIMGFTANYAAAVHEGKVKNKKAMDFGGKPKKVKKTKSGKVTAETKKYTRRSGAGAKFLEMALNQHYNEILGILAKNTYIK